MDHLGALVSPSISSNKWRYLACKCSHWPIGVCKRIRCIRVGKNGDAHIGMAITGLYVFHDLDILLSVSLAKLVRLYNILQ